ncbi:xanthine and co dehydrogenase maturation factor, xdhc/coxf family [hydrocarbon metagenome]|uniref:Xanthine and co dehydrogenase maturation factor, xdhc/coxf family n=1 Tax=hydrocarbon metagenome TaxID=938273 RepID=A0A0W8GAR1_9ZZZZ
MNDLLETLLSRLAAGESVTRAAIVTQEGSAPRAAGALMLVFADKTIAGTVGGGLVEARVMEAAAAVLNGGLAQVMDFNLTGEMAAGADMICGGRLSVFLERLDPDQAGEFIALRDRLAAGERCLLATPLDGLGHGGKRILLAEDGSAVVSGGAAPADHHTLYRAGKGLTAPACVETGGRRYVLEPCQGRPRLFLVGAGHVSRATALAAELAGFSVTVLDDRPEFASRERFPTAFEVAVADLTNCFAGRTITTRDMVVIVTRGHLHDAVVLAQTLGTKAGYVGMIGSRRKRDAIYDRLRAAGTADEELARVHCPVGLPIGAETPEEIAISIVAELIAMRAGKA